MGKKYLQTIRKLFSHDRFQKGNAGSVVIVGVVALMIGTGAASVGGLNPGSGGDGEVVTIVTPTPESSQSNLQLKSFGYITIAPTPTGTQKPMCPGDDDGKQVTDACQCVNVRVVCKAGVATNPDGTPFKPPKGDEDDLGDNPCGTDLAPSDGEYCVSKPVIYLYPTKPTLVDVSVISTGKVVVSDPHYPEGGWQDVLALPDGRLTYQGKNYGELFFETSVEDFKKPTVGITIPKDQIEPRLGKIIDQLGLIGREKEEFMEWWIPQLKAVPEPYIFFSILDHETKAELDTVVYNPKPDTEIAFIAYFKGVQTANNGPVLKLGPKPQRRGFVAVEWGGTLDTVK